MLRKACANVSAATSVAASRFKDEFIAARPMSGRWVLDVDVLAWARSKQAPEGSVG